MGYDQVVKADPAEDPAFCKVKMFSPVEMDLAFVFAAHRDINKPELMDEWKRQGGVHQQETRVIHQLIIIHAGHSCHASSIHPHVLSGSSKVQQHHVYGSTGNSSACPLSTDWMMCPLASY